MLFFLSSCRKDKCEEDPDRPPLKEEYLKWVYVENPSPRFKRTMIDPLGNILIDTLQGEHIVTFSDMHYVPKNPECGEDALYKVAEVKLKLKDKSGQESGRFLFSIDNYARKNGFQATFPDFDNRVFIDETTVLDTALINNKVYTNVFKYYNGSTLWIYYSKSIGFIYEKTESVQFELIP